MKTRVLTLLTALALGAGFATTASSTEPLSCDQIEWPAAVLRGFPDAPEACRNVIVRNGVRYAQFTAKFIRAESDGKVIVKVRLPGGHTSAAREFFAPRDFEVLSESGNSAFYFKELERGAILDVFISESRWTAKS